VIDWLNDNSGAIQAASAAVLALTLIAVAYYARQTRYQAEASVRMANEMTEQRLAADQPLLILDIKDQKLPDCFQWDEGDLVDQRTGLSVRRRPTRS